MASDRTTDEPAGETMPRPAASVPADVAREVEVKFLARPEQLKAIASSPLFAGTRWRGQRLRSVYYDTADGDLRENRVALRLRQQGRIRLLAAKWAGHHGDGFDRGEVEVRTRADEPRVEELGSAAGDALQHLIGDKPLVPQLETVVHRRTALLSRGGSLVEVALDRGEIEAGERRVPICEVEIELKDGSPETVFDVAREVLRVAPMRLGSLSKAQRGFLALSGEEPGPVKAAAIVLPETASVSDAIAAVIDSTLAQFVANWPSLEAADCAEAIHQMRVALRRLRAGLGLFRSMLRTDCFDSSRDEAKALAATLGAARDWDVFDEHVRSGPLAQFPSDLGLRELLAAVAERRSQAYVAARDLVAAADTTRFVLDLRSLSATRGWSSGAGEAWAEQPAIDFAVAALNRLHKKAVKRGRGLSRLDHAEKHELRIALKKLRYTADFFESLFGRSQLKKRFRRDIADLQESLGAYNDMATSRRLLDELDAAHPGLARASGLVLGWSARGMVAAEEDLARQWHAFRDLDRFWHPK